MVKMRDSNGAAAVSLPFGGSHHCWTTSGKHVRGLLVVFPWVVGSEILHDQVLEYVSRRRLTMKQHPVRPQNPKASPSVTSTRHLERPFD